MGLLDPVPPPYAPLEWASKPFAERAEMVCAAWALQGYGSPPAVYVLYVVKVALYVLGWALFCATSPALGGIASIGSWWLSPIAFEKAIVWSMLFEVLGFGCGSGPLTGRYFPPMGGFLYFLRPGTTKLPLFPKVPLIGGATRTFFDAALYLALVVLSVRALLAPLPAIEHIVPLVVIVPLLAIVDKTIFLAARAEHFWVTLVCFAYAHSKGDGIGADAAIGGAMAVQLALWFWAGFSKLNHHFPMVACVMTSNGPLTRFESLRRKMYKRYPKDLRPSALASAMAHAGTVMELAVPIAFVVTPFLTTPGTRPVVAIVLMLLLHGYITSNVPMGVPIEWNVVVVYGSFALFWAHPSVSLGALLSSPPLLAFLVVMLVAIPIAGNLFPGRISFLMAMRYYAGNWAYSVWLFRGDSYKKLEKLRTTSGWIYDQLARFYDRATSVGLFGKVMAFRMMHLHGRALPILVPKAVPRLEDYEWLDGEIVAGLVLGWNFGDGHLHREQLLESVQAQCGFEEGELRCIFVEAQPLFGESLAYRIVDAKTGPIENGDLPVAELRTRQPWESPRASTRAT
jgi:hypothetical protein